MIGNGNLFRVEYRPQGGELSPTYSAKALKLGRGVIGTAIQYLFEQTECAACLAPPGVKVDLGEPIAVLTCNYPGDSLPSEPDTWWYMRQSRDVRVRFNPDRIARRCASVVKHTIGERPLLVPQVSEEDSYYISGPSEVTSSQLRERIQAVPEIQARSYLPAGGAAYALSVMAVASQVFGQVTGSEVFPSMSCRLEYREAAV
jgi:hypothetical protein